MVFKNHMQQSVGAQRRAMEATMQKVTMVGILSYLQVPKNLRKKYEKQKEDITKYLFYHANFNDVMEDLHPPTLYHDNVSLADYDDNMKRILQSDVHRMMVACENNGVVKKRGLGHGPGYALTHKGRELAKRAHFFLPLYRGGL